MSGTYRLATDGDPLEKRCWHLFIQRDFPSYERFWYFFVVDLTNRLRQPSDIHFKVDAELGAMSPPRGFYDLYLAQLHYSVLWHLSAVHDLRAVAAVAGWETHSFVHSIIRLCSALDAADELLQVSADGKLSSQRPWDDAPRKRQLWRKGPPVHAYLMQLQKYRHQLIHSGPFMHLACDELRFPKVDRHADYRDWRRATSALTKREFADFATTSAIINEAWGRTLRYLERSWRRLLVARGLAAAKLPQLAPTRVLQDLDALVVRNAVVSTSTASIGYSRFDALPYDLIVLPDDSSSAVTRPPVKRKPREPQP